MEVSPTRQAQVAACEKLRDTVTGISALHMSLHDGRSFSLQNSFKELYLTSTQSMIKRKEEMVKQDVEHPLPTTNQVTTEVVTPKIKLPHPIMLKIKKNFREQIKRINEKFPNIRNRTVNDVVKMFTNDHEEYRNLIHFLESDKDFEFYIIKRNIDKPIKAPKKGTAFTDPVKKKNFVSKWTKEGISFANVVSGEIPSQTPPENNNNKKEDSPREFLSQEDNISDLAQALELFNIISKLVKKNPKILDLLSKFKNSNSDEEKTCLLAEAIMNNA
ncbi:hypothetical protein TNCV_4958671 [Trichonephila clavipes]|nr:hypothetical protein TNCV_4958671 [Trichonephila clavipes]